MKKKIIALTLILAIAASLAACGNAEISQVKKEVSVVKEEVKKDVKEAKEGVDKATEDAKEDVKEAVEETKEALGIEEKETPEPTEEPAPAEEPEAVDESSIRPDVKEAIDSYEAFVDEYCEFMSTYDSSDVMALAKYGELLIKENEALSDFEKIEDMDLTEAELNYYIEVELRCAEKMLKAANEM